MPDIPLPKPATPTTPVVGQPAVSSPPTAVVPPSSDDFSSKTTSLTPPPPTLQPQDLNPIMPPPATMNPGVIPVPPPPSPPGAPPPSSLPPFSKSPTTGSPVPVPNGVPRPPVGVSALSSAVSNKLPDKGAEEKKPEKEGEGKAPQPAKPKASPLKFLPIIIGGIIVLAGVIFGLTKLFGGSSGTTNTADTPSGISNPSTGSTNQGSTTTGDKDQLPATGRVDVPTEKTTLEYWGLWESAEDMSNILANYERDNPGVKINYQKQSHRDYRERLQTALASGNGPDIFRFHASWSPMLHTELAPMPSSIYSSSSSKDTFYPVASSQLTINGQLYGIPLMYDGLVLYYNRGIFETAGVEPPTTWAELRTLAKKLTVKSSSGIERGGLAIGNATNVDHFSDILAVLMLQNGAELDDPNSPETRDALLFYTNFIKADGVWSDTLPTSTVAFARGEAAMIFAPSWRAHEIKSINPDLDFATTTLPKLSETRIAWANYWAEGVSAMSKNQTESWKLLKYLSESATMQQTYSVQSQGRSFGEPYSRTDLSDKLATQPVVSSVLADAPYAKGWYLSSSTHDNGINDQLINYYKDAVTAILSGKSSGDVLTTLEQGTRQVLRQYGLDTASDRNI